MKQGIEQLLSMPDVCGVCRTAFSLDVTAAREDAWRKLPSVVGLPSWKELEAEILECMV